jgi:hypothetical protein
MTFWDGGDFASGPPGQIVIEIDRRTVSRVLIAAKVSSDFDENLQIDFSSSGMELEVDSSDPGWANQAFVAASEEIEKGVPAWSWVRRPTGRNAFVGFVIACVAVIVSLIMAHQVSSKSTENVAAAYGYRCISPLASTYRNPRYK